MKILTIFASLFYPYGKETWTVKARLFCLNVSSAIFRERIGDPGKGNVSLAVRPDLSNFRLFGYFLKWMAFFLLNLAIEMAIFGVLKMKIFIAIKTFQPACLQ